MNKKDFTSENTNINWNDKINIYDNNSFNFSDKINWDPQTYYNWCPHLLPCGLCAKTDRPCPKSKGNNFEPFVIWNNKPMKNNININGTFTNTVGDKKDE